MRMENPGFTKLLKGGRVQNRILNPTRSCLDLIPAIKSSTLFTFTGVSTQNFIGWIVITFVLSFRNVLSANNAKRPFNVMLPPLRKNF